MRGGEGFMMMTEADCPKNQLEIIDNISVSEEFFYEKVLV